MRQMIDDQLSARQPRVPNYSPNMDPTPRMTIATPEAEQEEYLRQRQALEDAARFKGFLPTPNPYARGLLPPTDEQSARLDAISQINPELTPNALARARLDAEREAARSLQPPPRTPGPSLGGSVPVGPEPDYGRFPTPTPPSRPDYRIRPTPDYGTPEYAKAKAAWYANPRNEGRIYKKEYAFNDPGDRPTIFLDPMENAPYPDYGPSESYMPFSPGQTMSYMPFSPGQTMSSYMPQGLRAEDLRPDGDTYMPQGLRAEDLRPDGDTYMPPTPALVAADIARRQAERGTQADTAYMPPAQANTAYMPSPTAAPVNTAYMPPAQANTAYMPSRQATPVNTAYMLPASANTTYMPSSAPTYGMSTAPTYGGQMREPSYSPKQAGKYSVDGPRLKNTGGLFNDLNAFFGRPQI